jgi:hypothetical protein
VELNPTSLYLTERLKQLGQEAVEGDSVPDPDLLLRFLSENTDLPRSTKSSNEQVHDILNVYLRTPNTPDNWLHLIGSNRVVHVTCNRQSNWRMATTAVRLSESMRSCWVTKADEINRSASHHSFRVQRSVQSFME